MPKFIYTGEDTQGQPVKETITANDRYSVYEVARQNGHSVSHIDEVKGFSFANFDMDRINAVLSRVKDDELVMLTRNLGSMLVAGLTVGRALSVMQRQTKNPKLKTILTDVIADINKGEQFNVALKKYPRVFNNLYVSMIRAGEESGKLAEALDTLAVQMERSTNLKKKIKGAMIYPSIVVTVMVVIGILMMIYVMPQITSVFEGMDGELPGTTKFLIAVSDFLVNYTVLALGGLVAIIVGFVYFLRSKPGKIFSSWTLVRLPVIGTMVKETNAARTARTLSSLLESGVDVIQSLEITEEVVQNIYYQKIIKEARDRVEKGTALSETFIEHEKLYPILVGEMILVGEETGQIAGMLKQLALFYENEVERKTKDLSTIIEPLLMVVIGSTVGFFALALIAPIYSISDAMQ